VDLIQQDAFGGTFGECLLQDTFLAGTLNEISDFKIVFIFKWLFGHKGRLPITRSSLPQDKLLKAPGSFSCHAGLDPAWQTERKRLFEFQTLIRNPLSSI
jgi:hypothetical protein